MKCFFIFNSLRGDRINISSQWYRQIFQVFPLRLKQPFFVSAYLNSSRHSPWQNPHRGNQNYVVVIIGIITIGS